MRKIILAAVFVVMAIHIFRLNRSCESLINELLQSKWDATPDFMGMKRFIESRINQQ